MRNRILALSILTASLGMTGCATSWEVSATCSQTAKCSATGKIGGTFDKRSIPLHEKILMTALADVPDASQFELDLCGSTVTYPSTGTVTLTLFNTTTNTAVAARQFAWYRSGNTLRLSDPNAVNAWAASDGGNANELRYTLARTDVAANPGENVITVTSKYQGSQTATSSSSFVRCTTYPSPYLCSGA